ncbi:hypothetical protein ROA7450_03115 [Roseovarius albus]|uniref:Uncharacterized protein n=1 Tax=Roseovarius albus TaxID=1247867 RepID=A0A1X6ZUJ6_9RHOB|nr:hypothetical protein ROA7450_03115 [Roseovarius albus]
MFNHTAFSTLLKITSKAAYGVVIVSLSAGLVAAEQHEMVSVTRVFGTNVGLN